MRKTVGVMLLSLGIAIPAAGTESHPAQPVYDAYCSVCHGDRGDGDSHARQGMVPPPRDFTSPAAAQELDRERILRAIRDGIPGSAMSAWKSRLTADEIEALADLILTRFVDDKAPAADSEGSRIYAAYCSVCHGDNGRGALWATAGLSPRPADFTRADFQAGMTRDHMIQSVTFGRPDTAMSGWQKRLSAAQIEAVVDYVIAEFMPDFRVAGKPVTHPHDDGHNHVHADPKVDPVAYFNRPLPDKLRGDPRRGAAIYRQNCVACHGEDGSGRGPRAYFIFPKPRNFLHAASRAALNRPTLYTVIARGKLRSEMPAWEKVLNSQQIADVSEYVFTTFIRP